MSKFKRSISSTTQFIVCALEVHIYMKLSQGCCCLLNIVFGGEKTFLESKVYVFFLAVKEQHACWRSFITAAPWSWMARGDPGVDASAQPERHPGSQWTARQHLQRLGGVRPTHPRLHAYRQHPPRSQDGETVSSPALQHRQEQLNR